MSLVIEKVGSGVAFFLQSGDWERCVEDGHGRKVEIHSHRGTQLGEDPGKEEKMRGEVY